MSIHHVKPHEIKWIPMTDEIRKLPLQKNSLYLLTNGDDATAIMHIHVRRDNPMLEYAMRSPNYTHLAIIQLPESAEELPTSYESHQIVTKEQHMHKMKWDRPVGSFIQVEEGTVAVEDSQDSCEGCVFYKQRDENGRIIHCLGNVCHPYERSDKKRVIFRPVMAVNFGPLEKGGAE